MIPPTFLAFGALFESGNLNRVEVIERSAPQSHKIIYDAAAGDNCEPTIQNSAALALGANAQQTVKLSDHSEVTQEYFLELSNDINTKGHVQWFHFAVGNTRVSSMQIGLRVGIGN